MDRWSESYHKKVHIVGSRIGNILVEIDIEIELIGIYFLSSQWSYLVNMGSLLGLGNERIENQIAENDSVSDRVEGRVAITYSLKMPWK